MSTITVQTISNGSVSTNSANVIQGSAKAWVNFNGTGTVAIRASYNVSSITDNGTGDYTVNFTNAMPDANYSAVAATVGTVGFTPITLMLTTLSASNVRLSTVQATGALDRDPVCVTINR